MPRDAATGRIQLKPAQERVLAALKARDESELTRGHYQELAGVSRSQAAYDLAELVEAGILHRVGAGRATRYRLPRENGGQRQWTSERIRAELEAFCDGRPAWPSAAAFKAAGRGDLYVAASRYGGIAHWSKELGYPRGDRAAPAEPKPEPQPVLLPEPQPVRVKRQPVRVEPQPSVWGRISWAVAGGVAAVGLVAAGVIVIGLPRVAKPTAMPSPGLSRPTSPSRATVTSARHAGTVSRRVEKKRPSARHERRAHPRSRPAKRRAPAPAHTRTTAGTSLVTYSSAGRSTYTPPTSYSPPQHSSTPPPPSSSGSGPTPLAAPPSGGAPQPIPPPKR